MVSTRITVDGIEEALLLLSRFEAGANDFRRAWNEIEQDFKEMEEDRFSRSGPGWAPLNPTYAAWKASRYPSQPLLVRTGNLRYSLTGGAGFISRIDGRQAEFGTSVRHGIFHQRGT